MGLCSNEKSMNSFPHKYCIPFSGFYSNEQNDWSYLPTTLDQSRGLPLCGYGRGVWIESEHLCNVIVRIKIFGKTLTVRFGGSLAWLRQLDFCLSFNGYTGSAGGP